MEDVIFNDLRSEVLCLMQRFKDLCNEENKDFDEELKMLVEEIS